MTASSGVLKFQCGASIAKTIILRSATTGQPVDLTGGSGRCQLRKDIGGSILVDFQTMDGSMTLGAALGSVTLNATPALSSTWQSVAGAYRFDVFVQVAGTVYKSVDGVAEVIAAITVPSTSAPPTLAPTVAPSSASASQVLNVTGATQSFTVTNPGAAAALTTFTAAADGVDVTSASCSPTSATIGAGGTQVVVVTYATGAATGTGSAVLTATTIGGSAIGVLAVSVAPLPPSSDIAALVASLSQTCLGFWDVRTLTGPGSYLSWPGRGGDLPLTGTFTVNSSGQVVASTALQTTAVSTFDLSTGVKTLVIGYLAQKYSGTGFGFWAGIAGTSGNQGQYFDRAVLKGAEGLASGAGNNAVYEGTVGAWAGQRSSNGKLIVGALSTSATPNTTVQYYPGLPITTAAFSTTLNAGNNMVFLGGNTPLGSMPFTGRWAACFAGALTQADLKKINAWSTANHVTTNDPGTLVVFDGDSRTLGVPSSGTDMSANYPTVAMADVRLAAYGDWNFGQGGQTAANMATRFSTVPHVTFTNAASTKKIYVGPFGGINDFAGGQTAAQIYANFKLCWAAARADGAKVVACTEISAGTSGWDAGAKETLNALIASVPGLYDALADFGANANVGADGQNTNGTYFQSDHIHPTAAGYAIMAGIAATAIASV